MKRDILNTFLAVAFAMGVSACAWTEARGQTPQGRQEVVKTKPILQGTKASAPIPSAMHVRNEGGSDGQGLCVISSIIANGMYQGIPGLETPGYDERTRTQMPGKGSALWRAAKGAPGGYGPVKLEAELKRSAPGEKYASHVGTDPAILDKLSRQGYPIGATMNTGELYSWASISHMISLIEYRTGGWACVVDNNDPGHFRWMLASEFARRWIDGSVGWAFWWLRKPPAVSATPHIWGYLLLMAEFLCLVGIAVALLLFVGKARRSFPFSNEATDVQGSVAGRDPLWPDLRLA